MDKKGKTLQKKNTIEYKDIFKYAIDTIQKTKTKNTRKKYKRQEYKRHFQHQDYCKTRKSFINVAGKIEQWFEKEDAKAAKMTFAHPPNIHSK